MTRGGKRKGAGRPPGTGTGAEFPERLNIPVGAELHEQVREAAAKAKQSVAEWARKACEQRLAQGK